MRLGHVRFYQKRATRPQQKKIQLKVDKYEGEKNKLTLAPSQKKIVSIHETIIFCSESEIVSNTFLIEDTFLEVQSFIEC